MSFIQGVLVFVIILMVASHNNGDDSVNITNQSVHALREADFVAQKTENDDLRIPLNKDTQFFGGIIIKNGAAKIKCVPELVYKFENSWKTAFALKCDDQDPPTLLDRILTVLNETGRSFAIVLLFVCFCVLQYYFIREQMLLRARRFETICVKVVKDKREYKRFNSDVKKLNVSA